ncbi:MAG: heavy metal translocating P-type ATPase [Bacteroidota bacterium]
MENFRTTPAIVTTCYHCGDTIRGEKVEHDGKVFCCSGCKTVFEILNQNNLCQYYAINQNPGVPPAPVESGRFDFLDDESVQKQLLQFSDGKIASVTLSLPSIHCSSCIWLLEHLYRLDAGVRSSKVDFLKKQISVSFDQSATSLRNVVVLLTSLGYDPDLRLDAINKDIVSDTTRTLYYKIGIAGFCFGNSMLFSFPEYLGVDANEAVLQQIFSYLNLLLGIPVFFYCSAEYFTSAAKGLRNGIINIDVPIAIGIILLFSRSVYEILSQTGPGFIDSLCGLLFFLLLGRVFQSKTYDRMNFERNYKSYFPISVTTKKNGIETSVPIANLEKHQRIVIRNNEIIPADSILLRGSASIDYSFVTGETHPVEKVLGEMIYAGGRQFGGIIELEVMKEVSQSYLTQLWNNFRTANKEEGQWSELSNTVSKYFTIVVLVIASVVGMYWLRYDVTTAINAFTGILIVACPCALAISIPFTLGTTMRIFGRNDFYLKNISVVERLSKIDTVVFDKTGTMTHAGHSAVDFVGAALSVNERDAVYSLTKNSLHPLSKLINEYCRGEYIPVDDFSEVVGKGISGTVDRIKIKLGNSEYVGEFRSIRNETNESRVYVSVNGVHRGHFVVQNVYRDGLKGIIDQLSTQYRLAVLSGDNESERIRLQTIFPKNSELTFNQMPNDKLEYVKRLQEQGKKTLMVGDGLNDAGALLQSDIGIAVTEDIAHFTPSSDAILASASFTQLPEFLRFSRLSVKIVIASFVFAFLYNTVGLFFAVQGQLSPIIAAILMPASSITIVIITTLTTQILARRRGLLS